jgi:hypothetical protein
VVTFARGGHVVARARAVRRGTRWVTHRHLRHGESAYVCAGGIRDAWGDLNGAPSAVVGRRAGRRGLRCPRVTLRANANDQRVTAAAPLG